MSFFKKTLASFGIGSAQVDTILKQDTIHPGNTLSIDVHVYGGATLQEITDINLTIYTKYHKELLNKEGRKMPGKKFAESYVLAKWSLPYIFTIEPHEDKVFPIELDIPWNTPITLSDANVWLETGLDIAQAVDPKDKDELTIQPDPLVDAIFTALENSGLRIRQAECEEVEGFELPFVQEFEFVPVDGPFHGRWRELEIVTYRTQEEMKIWFEVDRSQKGGAGMLASLIGGNKLKREIVISTTEEPNVAAAKVIAFLDEAT